MKTGTKQRRTQARALPWFGSDCMVCERYAALLADCKHVTVPFCGGLSVVAHLVETAGEIVCNDLHSLAMNFYACIADPLLRSELLYKLNNVPFHAKLLAMCQDSCAGADLSSRVDFEYAFRYFVTAWMGRSGKAGTDAEFKGGLAMRWDAGGGSSPLRYQTAVRSIQEVWGPICERCSFVCTDWSEILSKVKDDPRNGVYADPPWIGPGDDYTHSFTHNDHVLLYRALNEFDRTKVVLRYGDHPTIRKLYGDEVRWRIRTLISRDQANNGVGELCITNFGVV